MLCGENPVRPVRVAGADPRVTDDLLAEALSQIGESYTVVYTATPPAGKNRDSPPYEADFQEPVHMELKRRTGDRIILARDNGTTATTGSLFDRYQFFSPGKTSSTSAFGFVCRRLT